MRPTRLSSFSPIARRAARLLATMATLGALATLGACGGDVGVVTGSPVTIGGTGGGTTEASALVGRWTRVVLVPDGYGDFGTSETTWEFAADGVVTRILVTRSAVYGTGDVEVRTARWSLEGGTVVIRYVTPDAGTVRFRWRVERHADGDLLFLDETAFARVPA